MKSIVIKKANQHKNKDKLLDLKFFEFKMPKFRYSFKKGRYLA